MSETFVLNGETHTVEGDLTRRLLDYIRIDKGLTGTKESCQEGECGACLVLIDDEIYNACLVPMGNVIQKEVVTIEAFAKTKIYARIEQMFLETGAVQCGYCTPGMVMGAYALLKTGKKYTFREIKLALAGNLCRCTGYQTIFEAIERLTEEEVTHV